MEVHVAIPASSPAEPSADARGVRLGAHSFAFDRAVDLQLSRLRRKLTAAHGEAGNLFRTVRNEGYIFVASVRRI